MFDTIMQYVTSFGMLAAVILMAVGLFRDEIAYRRTKHKAPNVFEEHQRNKRD